MVSMASFQMMTLPLRSIASVASGRKLIISVSWRSFSESSRRICCRFAASRARVISSRNLRAGCFPFFRQSSVRSAAGILLSLSHSENRSAGSLSSRSRICVRRSTAAISGRLSARIRISKDSCAVFSRTFFADCTSVTVALLWSLQ